MIVEIYTEGDDPTNLDYRGRVSVVEGKLHLDPAPGQEMELRSVVDHTMPKDSSPEQWLRYAAHRFQGPHILAKQVE